MPPLSGSFGQRPAPVWVARLRFATGFATALCLSLLKLSLLWTSRGAELWLNLAVDACAWALLWLSSEWLAARRMRHAELLANFAFYPLLAFSAGLVFAHTWFFGAAIERRLTVFDVTWAGIGEFFESVLPPAGRVVAGGLLFGVLGLALLGARFLPRPNVRTFALTTALFVVPLAMWGRRAERVPSVFFDSADETLQILRLPKLQADQTPETERLADLLVQDQGLTPTTNLAFRKVVVLVMETMTARMFEAQAHQVPLSSFVRSERARAHRYVRYFPNNQDSRTGMLNMLFGRVIPYEAYSERGLAGYAQLPRRPSLVDRFRARSYRTAFAVSQVALEEVVSELPWDTFLHWTEPEIARARERFVCLAPDEYENGCEDRALLPKVLDFLAANERAFVYQEFIWGHSPEYNERTGKTNTAYYSAYVDELLSGLAARGLSDDTLIVLTSDHGFRDKSKQAERWVYHIPLWFYARRFQGSESSALLSHTDFGALLATEASLLPNTVDRPLVMVVGPTGNGMLAGITHEDELLLMRRRGPFQLLATPEDARTGKAPGPSPGELLGAFQSYRARFDAWLAH